MADPTLSKTTIDLLTLEVAQANIFSAMIAEKIGSEDLSNDERAFWLQKQENLLNYSKEVLAVAEVWYELRKELNLIMEPVQELSEIIQ
jgi:hypothetical protein